MSTSHNLTSALSTMALQIGILQKNMPVLLEGYHYAVEKGFGPANIQPRHAELIGKIGDHLKDELERVKSLMNV